MGEYDLQWYKMILNGTVEGWGYQKVLQLEEIKDKSPEEIFAKGRAFGTLEEKIKQLATAMDMAPKETLGPMAVELRDMYHAYIDVAEALSLPIRSDVRQAVNPYLNPDDERLRYVKRHPDKEHLLDTQSDEHEPPVTQIPF